MTAAEALEPLPPRRDAVDDSEIARTFDRTPKDPSSGGRKIAMLAAAVLAVLAIWFGAQALTGRVDNLPVAPRDLEPMAAAPAGRPAAASEPNPALADVASGAPAAPAPGASPVIRGEAGGERVEIIVASFRTEARAASVMTAVSGLGLPVRLRAAAGWQQVMTGPFGSRVEADEARQRLERAGLAGTQTVPADRRGP